MHKGMRSAILIAGAVAAVEVLAGDSGKPAPSGFGVHSYCIRLLGEHAKPVASKNITVSTDDEARELAAQFLNEYDKDLGSNAVAYPFIVVEGHPCMENVSLAGAPTTLAQADRPHHRHHHHHHHDSKSAEPKISAP